MTMKNFFLISNTGATLVEVMIALIIIALVILGGGMFFFHGRVNIIQEAHRRAAVLVASQRLEELKGADWDVSTTSDQTKLELSDGELIVLDPIGEVQPVTEHNLTVDNLSDAERVTGARWIDDGSNYDYVASYDYLEVTVTVDWTDSTANSVSLTTLLAPR